MGENKSLIAYAGFAIMLLLIIIGFCTSGFIGILSIILVAICIVFNVMFNGLRFE